MRFDAAFCTNSICAPSRAAILTGTYNHVNGVTTLDTPLDNRLWTFPQAMQAAGYRTGLVGKWHLGHGPAHDPVGFDEWRVLPGQGHYHDPVMLGPGGAVIERGGYVTDLITDDCIDFIDRDDGRPFLLLCHHKAAHRTWEPDEAHAALYDGRRRSPSRRRSATTSPGGPTVVQAVRMRMLDLDPFRDLGAAGAGRAHARRGGRAGGTSASSRATCTSSRRSTTTSAACSITSTRAASPTTPS